MPSLGDSAVIFVIALILFGPKRLPELARQLGKLMGEFRRASNEFRMQMEDELRVADQAEQQQKIAAMEAAAPVAPALESTSETITTTEAENVPDYIPGYDETVAEYGSTPTPEPHTELAPEPLPIATSGDLHIMPPATGLPVARNSESSTLTPVLESIPHTPDPEHLTPSEPSFHG